MAKAQPTNIWQIIAVVTIVVVQLIVAARRSGRVDAMQSVILQRLDGLEKSVQTNIDDRYRGSDAKRDFAEMEKYMDTKFQSADLNISKVDLKLERHLAQSGMKK